MSENSRETHSTNSQARVGEYEEGKFFSLGNYEMSNAIDFGSSPGSFPLQHTRWCLLHSPLALLQSPLLLRCYPSDRKTIERQGIDAQTETVVQEAAGNRSESESDSVGQDRFTKVVEIEEAFLFVTV